MVLMHTPLRITNPWLHLSFQMLLLRALPMMPSFCYKTYLHLRPCPINSPCHRSPFYTPGSRGNSGCCVDDIICDIKINFKALRTFALWEKWQAAIPHSMHSSARWKPNSIHCSQNSSHMRNEFFLGSFFSCGRHNSYLGHWEILVQLSSCMVLAFVHLYPRSPCIG